MTLDAICQILLEKERKKMDVAGKEYKRQINSWSYNMAANLWGVVRWRDKKDKSEIMSTEAVFKYSCL